MTYECKPFNKLTIQGTRVVNSTDLSGMEPHRQVDIDRGIASGNLRGVMATILALEEQDVWVRILFR